MVAIFLLILILFIACIYFIITIDQLRSGLAPAISTPIAALKPICQALNIKPGAEVWELGCGDARVISYCAKAHTDASFIGIENGIIMQVRAKWRTRSQPNVRIKYGNIKSGKPITATNMYLYLLPQALDIVKPRIPSGCKVVSLEFKLSNKTPTKVIKLIRPSKFAHQLYIYKF